MTKIVRVNVADGKYSADATWLPGSPPVARGWSSQELAIAVLKDMLAAETVSGTKDDWGPWPDAYEVIIERA